MYRSIVLALITGVLMATIEAGSASAERCRMEQQCHWKNFKKYCVWVKVCR
jgi:hypothetical protein